MDLRKAIARFDDDVDRRFNRIRGNKVADRLFYTASELGDWSLIWHLFGVGQALFEPPGPAGAVRLSTALGAESLLVNGGIKNLFRRERPLADATARPHMLRQPLSSSFPSGHASSAFMAASILSQQTPRGRSGFYLVAVIVASSRIHVRIHHASDVVAGALLGAVLGRLVNRFWPAPG